MTWPTVFPPAIPSSAHHGNSWSSHASAPATSPGTYFSKPQYSAATAIPAGGQRNAILLPSTAESNPACAPRKYASARPASAPRYASSAEAVERPGAAVGFGGAVRVGSFSGTGGTGEVGARRTP